MIVAMATFPPVAARPNTLYVEHPTRADMQDESYFVKDVVPYIDAHYTTLAEPCGRLLTGFCASGNGAMWLLLRHLELFGRAAVWETWLDLTHMHEPDEQQVGDDTTFQRYCCRNLIHVQEHRQRLRDGPTRIIVLTHRSDRDPASSLACSNFPARATRRGYSTRL